MGKYGGAPSEAVESRGGEAAAPAAVATPAWKGRMGGGGGVGEPGRGRGRGKD